MLNMIKMDLYRLFKTKSMYVILLVMAGILLLTTYMTKVDMEASATQEQGSQVEEMSEESESMNLGMSVYIPTEQGERITVYDMFYGNAQGKALAIFVVIFAVLFSAADSSSGYIKNIGGQVKHRGGMILSKTLALLVYTALTMSLCVLMQMVFNQIVLGYVKLGDIKQFTAYFVIQVILHFALASICMAVAILLRNNVCSMIIAICLCMNVLIIVYGVIDKIVHKMGYEDFAVIRYTVTGKISLLPMDVTQKAGFGAIAVSAVFILVMTFFSSILFEKRDIV